MRKTVTKLITLTIALAAMALIGSSLTTGRASVGPVAPTRPHVKVFSAYPIGYVSGQTLRFSVFNPNAPEQGSEPVRA